MIPGRRIAAGSCAVGLGLAGVVRAGLSVYLVVFASVAEFDGGAGGEVLMGEGIRMEEAGQRENAVERYAWALEARFAGEFNRRHTEKRLGALLLRMGRPEEAVPHLRAALEGAHAVGSAHEPLAEALYQTDRLDEAAEAVAAWTAWAEAAGNDGARAEALFHAGRLAWRAGDTDRAIALHEAGNALRPGGRSASDLGILYAERGDAERALRHLDEYLTHGGSGERAAYARALRERLLREREAAAP